MACRLQLREVAPSAGCPPRLATISEGDGLREMTDIDYYKTLQVDREADPEVIAAAHRVLTARLHPETDLTGVDEIRRAELDRAYAVLSDPFRRTAYDQQREYEMVAMGPGNDPGTGAISETVHDHQRLSMGALTERIQAGPNGENVANVKLDFGRYAGWTLGELARADPDYLRWLSRHSSGIRYRGAILRLLAQTDGSRPLQIPR
jgi:curved DNA-binding protein CbpA